MQPKAILVVDDDPDLLSSVRELLSDAGHLVYTLSSGVGVLSLLETERIDLVIIDIVMPDKEGIGTIREMKKAFPVTKIIAISGGGAGGVNYLAMAKGLGANATLGKPFGGHELLSLIDQLLGK